MDMQKLTVNGKKWKELETELAKPISAKDILEFAVNVENRIRDVWGANYSISLNVSNLSSKKFLTITTLSIRCDTGEVIASRDGVATDEDCDVSRILSFVNAAQRFSVPCVFSEPQSVECRNETVTVSKAETASEQEHNESAEEDETEEDVQAQEDAICSQEQEDETVEETQEQKAEVIEFSVDSNWSRTKQNQFWCGVFRKENGKVCKDRKYILVIGEEAQKLMYFKIFGEETDKMSVISPKIYAILQNYKVGSALRCVAELRDDREYLLVDIPNTK